jgi:hypothetical protein
MSYATTNPPIIVSCSPCGTNKRFAYYSTDAVGTVDAAGYFTNGLALGMAVGDEVWVYNTTSSLNKATTTYVDAVSSTGATVVIESS